VRPRHDDAPADKVWRRRVGELRLARGFLQDLPTRKNSVQRELSPLNVGREKQRTAGRLTVSEKMAGEGGAVDTRSP
jgi:hypothetical protein